MLNDDFIIQHLLFIIEYPSLIIKSTLIYIKLAVVFFVGFRPVWLSVEHPNIQKGQ